MKSGVLLSLCVLLVVTVLPLASADNVKQLADSGAQAAQEAAQNGQQAAAQKAQEAQGQADRLQGQAHGQVDTVSAIAASAADEASAGFANLLKNAQVAVARFVCYLTACGDSGTPGEQGYAMGAFKAESTTLLPAEAGPLAGLAMVVAAGAVGGALLWFVVLQRGLALGAPLLSRIAHSEIYTNDARRLISEIAVSNPGLCLNDIVARTGYSRNAVSYHLFVLEKEQELVSIKDGKYRRYFPRGGKYVNGAKTVVSALRNATTLKMAQEILARPGTIQRELCQALGTTASAACWHAKRLESLGVIRKERVANTVKYFPGDELGRHDYSEFGLVSPGLPAPGLGVSLGPSLAPAPL